MKFSLTQKCMAEFFGTFVLVFMGTGAAVLAGNTCGFPWASAFSFGLSVAAQWLMPSAAYIRLSPQPRHYHFHAGHRQDPL